MIVSPAELARAEAYVKERLFLPWAEGAFGPRAYDCQGLTHATQRDLFGRTVPLINVDPKSLLAVAHAAAHHPLRDVWTEHRTPRHGDVMMMARATRPTHFGTYLAIDRGTLFHSVEVAGVRADRINTLEVLGWSNVTYWRPPAQAAAAQAMVA